MVDVKEIKSIELVPFTLMTSSISAILALIYAIILLITFGVLAAVYTYSRTGICKPWYIYDSSFPNWNLPCLHYNIVCNSTHLQHACTKTWWYKIRT